MAAPFQQAPMPPPQGRTCVQCGQPSLVPRQDNVTRKRRSKFGVGWLIFTVLTGGLALILYLIWPRHSEVVAVDRYLQCTSCGARQV